MAETRRLKELVAGTLDASRFPDAPLLVALSGGADSAALALLAVETRVQVRAAYVDHGTPHAPLLRAAAEKVAAGLDLPLLVLDSGLAGQFTEDLARKARYRALLGALADDEWLVTGHSLDDQVETVLMNVVRGAGLSGLSGIPERTTDRVARPLLGIRRSELREVATLAGLGFVDDPSNDDDSFTRNRIRHEVLPLLADINPAVVRSLARVADAAGADDYLLERLTDELPVTLGEGACTTPVSVIEIAPPPIADRLLRRMVRHLRPPYSPTADEVGRIRDVAAGRSARAELEGGVVVASEAGMLRISV